VAEDEVFAFRVLSRSETDYSDCEGGIRLGRLRGRGAAFQVSLHRRQGGLGGGKVARAECAAERCQVA
jgi:hypothetical protein